MLGIEEKEREETEFFDDRTIMIGDLRYFVGQRLDVLDETNRWDEAEVIEVRG